MGYGSIHGIAVPSNSLAVDVQSLGQLKADAGKTTPESIRETAKQFESLFMRELLKSMREATMKSGMLDNPGSDLGTDMLDQQFAVQMSGQPRGLSDLIAQQLSRQSGVELEGLKPPMPPADPARNVGEVSRGNGSVDSVNRSVNGNNTIGTSNISSVNGNSNSINNRFSSNSNTINGVAGNAKAPAGGLKPTRPATVSQVNFVNKHSEIASKVERESGIPASFMLGQAGHETGWGRFEIKQKGGAPSFNLFGIKAGASWTGKVAEVTTTEYVNGVAQKKVARFRAYESYEDSFKDYARLISDSPRYSKVKAQTGSVHAFATGLQKAGYATDPEYAAKLSRAINTTLQLRRVQV